MADNDDVDLLLTRLADLIDVQSDTGIYVGPGTSDGSGTAYVDYREARLPMAVVGSVPPAVGRPVRILKIGTKYLALGDSAPRDTMCKVVTASSGGKVMVETPIGSGKQIQLDANPDIAYTVGDTAVINWEAGNGIVAYRFTKTAPPVVVKPPDPTPPAVVQDYNQSFQASDSASWRSGGWNTTDVYFGQSYGVGAWFYGSQLRNTIPDDAQILSLEIWVRVNASSGVNPIFGWHTNDGRPGGDFDLNDKTTIGGLTSGFAGWVGLPASWAENARSGAFGIGVRGAGYRRFVGRASDGESGRLRIKWRK